MKRQFEGKEWVGSCPGRRDNQSNGPEGRMPFCVITNTRVADIQDTRVEKGSMTIKKRS